MKPNDRFVLQSSFKPTGDQPEAIDRLVEGISNGSNEQVLLGVTGSGKTFTIAHVIERLQRPTLVLSHNKTLAAQLYQEFRDFFPQNAVSYFVSYYDYYQPEAYVPQTDTYIEKETEINEEIDKLRLAATTNLLTRKDTLIVASVSCIYNIGSPREYGHFVLELAIGMKVNRQSVFERLVQLQYERNDYGFHRGTFRVRGDTIDIFPAYEDRALRIVVSDAIAELYFIDPLTGKKDEAIRSTVIYPAKHYMTDPSKHKSVFEQIQKDLLLQEQQFKKQGKLIEAQRIHERVNYDLEMIQEMGYVNGIENYSRYFDGRKPGDPPFTLFDYYQEAVKNNWLLIVDESHMTIPQVRGMYNGDRSRKQTLIDFGFRLPSALDNRPMKFDEFLRGIPQTIYVSATPDSWEISRARDAYRGKGDANQSIVQQLIRPTGLIDPSITVRPTRGQIDDLMNEIQKRVANKERVLVTTLTKRMAEDLTSFLEEHQIRVQYLHSDIETLKRTDILTDLRSGTYDVIVGINLLREGLDLPEVSLVAILDADKEGFLRSRISLIQTMGRAARHIHGEVIMYADRITDSMKAAIDEVDRRRVAQVSYNSTHGITPTSISKPIRPQLVDASEVESTDASIDEKSLKIDHMTPYDKQKVIASLTSQMRKASRDLHFEQAAKIRDLIAKLS